MKKILLATTAIIVTNVAASADVNLIGDARLGLVNNGDTKTTKVEKRLRINVNASAEADAFDLGGNIRLTSEEAKGNSVAAGGNVYLETDTMRVTVGNTNGAANHRVATFAGGVGLTGLEWRNVPFNIGNDNWGLNSQQSGGDAGDVLRIDFNLGDLGVSVSADKTGEDLAGSGSETSLAISYAAGDWKVGVGAVQNINGGADGTAAMAAIPAVPETPTVIGVPAVDAVDAVPAGAQNDAIFASIGGSIAGLGVGIGYGSIDEVGSKIVVHGTADLNGTSVTLFVASTSEEVVGKAATRTGGVTTDAVLGSAGVGPDGSKTEYGIGFSRDLGGATLAGGIVSDYEKTTHADIGVSFSF